ncbi:MAG: serine/threonine protein kinase [Phycisphaerales bacterium]|nr:serine/threonine protein kinase [Phycisphaerales bacterium]MCB9864202.1 serine/threonine protein kinase [Phycisphaerales bacterium]
MSERNSVEWIFSEACKLQGNAREEFLVNACGDNVSLRAEVDSLLEADNAAGSFLAGTPASDDDQTVAMTPAGAHRKLADPSEQSGTRIGRYKLLQEIGEGGFGTVWMAEQEEPVRRRVALKIIKLGMDTRQVIARFEAERQALAMMDHPNIARVFDAGSTDKGRPYFVMELVKGVPITDYCDQQNMGFAERLALFVQVCSAVQHAHQKGIIHRDLKPSNILVTRIDDKPAPKVIDFGIAKATQQRLTEQTMFTEFGQFIGTPAYMSPEQADPIGDDIDTRSDIYSLGVILYQLLTGVTPFDIKTMRAAALNEIKRIIREVDPPRPSTRLSSLGEEVNTVARQRAIEPRRLGHLLRGDLDWIIMKALEKDRTRRYETASGLAADVERYLHHEPVTATPPSHIYRLRKFANRNRGVVTAGALVAFALVIGVIGTTYGMIAARRERANAVSSERIAIQERDRAAAAEADARARAEEVEKVAAFQSNMFMDVRVPVAAVRLHDELLEKVRAAATEAKLSAGDIDARVDNVRADIAGADFAGLILNSFEDCVFAPALAAVDKQFADQPAVRARLQQTIAQTTRELGMLQFAEAPQRAALATRKAALGPDHPDTFDAMTQMGSLLRAEGKLADAEHYLVDALAGLRRTVGNDDPRTLTCLAALGNLRQLQGRHDDADQCYRECLDRGARVFGPEDRFTLEATANLGYLLCVKGRFEEAESLLKQALDGQRRVLGPEQYATLQTMNNLGALMRYQNRLDEADRYYSEALAARRRVLGDDHPQTLSSLDNMGGIRYSQGRYEESLELAKRAYEGRLRMLGPDHLDTLHSVFNIGALLMKLDRAAEAEQNFRQARDGFTRLIGRDRPDTIEATYRLGLALMELKKAADAEKNADRPAQSGNETEQNREEAEPESGKTTQTRRDAAQLADEAERVLRDAIDCARRGLGEAHPKTIQAVFSLADLLEQEDRAGEAVQLILDDEPAVRRANAGPNEKNVGGYLSRLGESCRKAHDFERGEKSLLEAFDLLKTGFGEEHASTKQCAARLAGLYQDWNAAAPDEEHANSAAEWRRKAKTSGSD